MAHGLGLTAAGVAQCCPNTLQDAREQSAARPQGEDQHQQQSAANASGMSAAHGSAQQRQWATATPVSGRAAGGDYQRLAPEQGDLSSEHVDPASTHGRSAPRHRRLDELDEDALVDDDDDVVLGTPPAW